MTLVSIGQVQIDPNKYYSIRKLHMLNVFPWIGSYHSFRQWVRDDIQKNENRNFKAIIKGAKTGLRYLIKGSTVIELANSTAHGHDFTKSET